MFLYVFLGALIGARLGHCIFYEPEEFFDSWQHFVEIFIPIKFLSDGSWKFVGFQGLASHGGVIGLLVGLYLYIKRSKMNTWVVLDFMGICSAIASTFIRLGNLMNSEIIGKVTDVPWAFIFYKVDTYPRHPGQLYEAIAYFCFFWIILLIYRKHPTKVGTGLYFGLCLALIFTLQVLHRIHERSAGGFRSWPTHRHGTDSQYPVHSHRLVVGDAIEGEKRAFGCLTAAASGCDGRPLKAGSKVIRNGCPINEQPLFFSMIPKLACCRTNRA